MGGSSWQSPPAEAAMLRSPSEKITPRHGLAPSDREPAGGDRGRFQHACGRADRSPGRSEGMRGRRGGMLPGKNAPRWGDVQQSCQTCSGKIKKKFKKNAAIW